MSLCVYYIVRNTLLYSQFLVANATIWCFYLYSVKLVFLSSIRSGNSDLIGVEDNPEFDEIFGKEKF